MACICITHSHTQLRVHMLKERTPFILFKYKRVLHVLNNVFHARAAYYYFVPDLILSRIIYALGKETSQEKEMIWMKLISELERQDFFVAQIEKLKLLSCDYNCHK